MQQPKKSHKFTVRLEPDQYRELASAARARRVTASWLAREYILEGLGLGLTRRRSERGRK